MMANLTMHQLVIIIIIIYIAAIAPLASLAPLESVASTELVCVTQAMSVSKHAYDNLFGEDDLELCRAAGIPVVVPVDDEGRFTSEVPDWASENVFEANPKIIRALKEAGKLVRHDTIVHNYPHC